MKRGRFAMVSVWIAGLVIVGLLVAQLALALRENAVQHRRLAALEAAQVAQQQSQWTIAITAWNVPQPFPLEYAESDTMSDDLLSHPMIVPVPPEVDQWILEMRVPVTEEERARWIPFEFDGITYYLVPL